VKDPVRSEGDREPVGTRNLNRRHRRDHSARKHYGADQFKSIAEDDNSFASAAKSIATLLQPIARGDLVVAQPFRKGSSDFCMQPATL
jgi:hypothetical protein